MPLAWGAMLLRDTLAAGSVIAPLNMELYFQEREKLNVGRPAHRLGAHHRRTTSCSSYWQTYRKRKGFSRSSSAWMRRWSCTSSRSATTSS